MEKYLSSISIIIKKNCYPSWNRKKKPSSDKEHPKKIYNLQPANWWNIKFFPPNLRTIYRRVLSPFLFDILVHLVGTKQEKRN